MAADLVTLVQEVRATCVSLLDVIVYGSYLAWVAVVWVIARRMKRE